MEPKTFTCTTCSEKIIIEKDGDSYRKDGGRLCYNCYREEYLITCDLCEEHFEKACTAKKYYFVLMPQDEKSTGLKSGIYRGKEFPIWRSDMFSVDIDNSNVELIKPLKKDILDKDCHTNQICPECFQKYTDEKWLSIKRKTILLDALIANIQNGQTGKIIKKHKGDFKYFNKVFKPLVENLKFRHRIQVTKMYKRQHELI